MEKEGEKKKKKKKLEERVTEGTEREREECYII